MMTFALAFVIAAPTPDFGIPGHPAAFLPPATIPDLLGTDRPGDSGYLVSPSGCYAKDTFAPLVSFNMYSANLARFAFSADGDSIYGWSTDRNRGFARRFRCDDHPRDISDTTCHSFANPMVNTHDGPVYDDLTGAQLLAWERRLCLVSAVGGAVGHGG